MALVASQLPLWSPRVGLGVPGVCMTLLGAAALLTVPARSLLALRRAAREGLVLITLDSSGTAVAELLPNSRVVWTDAGAPTAWRAPS